MRVFKATYKDRKGHTREAAAWYVEFRDHLETVRRLPAFPSKAASEEMGRNLEKLVAYHKASDGQTDPALTRFLAGLRARTREKLVSIGLMDPERAGAGKLLADHLEDFHADLLNKGTSAKQAGQVVARIRRVLTGCRFVYPADLSGPRVQTFLADFRRDRPATVVPADRDWFTKSETAAILSAKPSAVNALIRRHRLEATGEGKARRYPRSTVETLARLRSRGASVQTANHILANTKQFARWLVRSRCMGENPLAHLSGGNARTDRRHDRQTLSIEQMTGILEAARASDRTFRGLNGTDRRALYLTAMSTGFRACELSTLAPESFDLDADPPTATVASAYTKNRQTAVQPVPAAVAALLRSYLAGRRPALAGHMVHRRRGNAADRPGTCRCVLRHRRPGRTALRGSARATTLVHRHAGPKRSDLKTSDAAGAALRPETDSGSLRPGAVGRPRHGAGPPPVPRAER